MTKQVQRRRGTATQHTSFTGAEGELSVNTTNKSVHVHDGSTAGGIELARKDGSNVAFTSGTLDGVTIGGTTAGAGTFTNLTATGTTTLAGASTSANITFGDNDKAIFGAGSDLQIYHSGTASFIDDVGTGSLNIRATDHIISDPAGNNKILATTGGSVDLFHNASKKLATTSTGIDVTGTVTADGLTVDAGSTSTIATFDTTANNSSTVYGDAASSVIISNDHASGTARLKFRGTASESGAITFGGGIGSASDTFSVYPRAMSGGKSFTVSGGGDISFYEDTGTTAKFFWDASAESLGIGTSTFDNAAQVVVAKGDASVSTSDADNSGFNFTAVPDTTTGKVGIGFKTFNETASAVAALYATPINQYRNSLTARYNADGSGAGYFSVEQLIPASATVQERMRIDSSGNVGINGSPSPSDGVFRLIQIGGANKYATFGAQANGGFAALMGSNFYYNGGWKRTDAGRVTKIETGPDSSSEELFSFQYAGDGAADSAITWSEAMRIDSSGDLLVGHTDRNTTVSNGASGATIGGDGFIGSSRLGSLGEVMVLNREDSDGSIMSFRKDGTTVGSIGASGGDLLIGTGDTAVRFVDADDALVPFNTSGSGRDAAIDLGKSAERFKDLYLSGGVYLGGTGAANKLEDYEEGTWTPAVEYDTNGTLSVTYSQRNGAYTKVGNMVTIWGVIRLNGFSKGTASGSLKFTGLPFSSTTVGYRTDLKVLSYRAPFNGPGGFGAMIDNGSSYIACVYSRNDNTWTAEADPDSNSEYFFSGSYFTTA